MGKIIDELKKKFESFTPAEVDPWKRVGGSRLTITPSGYGLREDGEGKLVHILDSDYIVGRDEKRYARLLETEAKNQSSSLFRLMTVDRDMISGRYKLLNTQPVPKKDCMLRVVNGEIRKPRFLFVRYVTRQGSSIFRKVLSEC